MIQVGYVLKYGDSCLKERLVTAEEFGLPSIDAGRVQADGCNLAIARQPFRGRRIEARKVQLCYGLRTSPIGAEILPRIRIEFPPARAQQHNDTVRNAAVRILPSLQILLGYQVISIRGTLFCYVDDHARGPEPLQRNLINRRLPLREMNRGVDVRSTVLRGAEAVGGIVIALVRNPR